MAECGGPFSCNRLSVTGRQMGHRTCVATDAPRCLQAGAMWGIYRSYNVHVQGCGGSNASDTRTAWVMSC